jgi:hypothetical protein
MFLISWNLSQPLTDELFGWLQPWIQNYCILSLKLLDLAVGEEKI